MHIYNLNKKKIKFFNNEYKALINANALVLVTEWAQFRQPNFEMIIDYLKEPIIIDGRNQYDPTYLKSVGIDYFGIGRSNVKF